MKKFILPIILSIVLIASSTFVIPYINEIKINDESNCKGLEKVVAEEVEKELDALMKEYDLNPNNSYGEPTYKYNITTLGRGVSSYYAQVYIRVYYGNSYYNIGSTTPIENVIRDYSIKIDNSNVTYKNHPVRISAHSYMIRNDSMRREEYVSGRTDYNVPRANLFSFVYKIFFVVFSLLIVFLLYKCKKADMDKNTPIVKLFYEKCKANEIDLHNYKSKTDQLVLYAKEVGLKKSNNSIIEIFCSQVQKEIREQEKEHKIAEKLYNACAEVNIKHFVTSKSDIERIALIAKKLEIKRSNTEIQKMYNDYLQYKNDEIARRQIDEAKLKKAEQLNQLRTDEMTQSKINQMFKDYIGRKKLELNILHEIKNLESYKSELTRQINAIKFQYKSAYHGGKQHVPDWAIHGGVASGIAGGVAGAMVAMDVKQRADAAKSSNAMYGANLLLSEAQHVAPLHKKIESIEKEIELLNKKLKNIDTVLVENISEEMLLMKLNPEYSCIEVSETGNTIVFISTTAHTLNIFDDTKAVIDGTIEVLLMNGDNQIGTAYFSLPYSGSANNFKTKVYCTNITEKVTDVKFKPYHLWAVEKI